MADEIVRVDPYWYNERECLGTGSFGEVYKGYNGQNKTQLLAIKRIKKGQLPQSIVDKEIQILQELSAPDVHHLNFVTLLDCVQTERHVYLVMEYCNGGDLEHFIKGGRRKMNESEIKLFLQQIASALKILHAHEIVHRDLKPANILLSHNGRNGVQNVSDVTFKIADFGLGRFLDQGVQAQTFCGTPVYMAPEIFVPNAKYDYKADLWSVGAIAYQCFTGTLFSAFQKEPIKFPISTSEPLRDLLRRLLEKEPKDRMRFNDFYDHQFIDMKTVDATRKVTKPPTRGATMAAAASPAAAGAAGSSTDSGASWFRRVFSFRDKKRPVKDDKEKILSEENASSSNPASPSKPLSPKGAVQSPGPNNSPAYNYNAPDMSPPSGSKDPNAAANGPTTSPQELPKRNWLDNFFTPKRLNPIPEIPTTQLVKSLTLDNRDIYGVAHFDVRLYILCRSPNVLGQYSDQSPFIKIKDINIEANVKLPQDVAGCPHSRCLYVTDIGNNCIWKVETGFASKINRWGPNIGSPHTLSVSRDGRVVTFSIDSKSVEVYGPDASLVHRVPLPSDVRPPQHAVETSKGTIVVSFGDLKAKKHGVCEISVKGKVVRRYEHKTEKLNHPTHLAIDADDRVYVADNFNDRIILLDSNLKFEQILPTEAKDRLDKPFRVCIASVKGQKRLVVQNRKNAVDIFSVS